MMKPIAFLTAVLFASPAAAQQPPAAAATPDPQEIISQMKIQLGQSIAAIGGLELEVDRLRKELAKVKAPPPSTSPALPAVPK